MRKSPQLLLLTLLLSVILVGCSSRTSSDELPATHIGMPWDNYAHAPGWSEVAVTLTAGSSAWQGQVRIKDSTQKITYVNEVAVPAGGKSTVTIPIYFQNATQPTLELVQRDQVVDSRTLKPKFESNICVVLGEPATVPDHTMSSCLTHVVLDSWETIPTNPLMWESVNHLYITSAMTGENAPTPEQLQAMTTWVSQGGHLSLFGEPVIKLIGTTEEWMQIYISEAPSEHKVVHDPSWSFTFPTPLWSATLAIADTSQIDALLTSNRLILAARQAYGWGTVNIAGWSCNQTPTGWYNYELTEWQDERLPPVGQTTGEEIDSAALSSIYKIGSIGNNSGWLLVILMLLYIIFIGPGVLILVRRQNRPLLTWLLVPSWIVLSVLIISLVLQGTIMKAYPVTGEAAILEYPVGASQARVSQYMAMYAPRSKSLSWESDGYGKSVFGKFQDDYWYQQGNPYAIAVNQQENGTRNYTTQDAIGVLTWAFDNYISMPVVVFNLTANQLDSLKVNITGDIETSLALSEIYLVYDKGYYALKLTDIIEAHSTLAIDEISPILYNEYANGYLDFCMLGNTQSPMYGYYSYGYPNTEEARWFPETNTAGIHYSIPNDGLCHIVATSDQLPIALQTNSQPQGMTCLLMAIPCP